MNNTKWREVFSLAVELECRLLVSDIRSPSHFVRGNIDESMIAEDHIRDPGFGGPVTYVQIFALRVERYEATRDPSSGRTGLSSARADEFLNRLDDLGMIERVLGEDFIEVRGYAA